MSFVQLPDNFNQTYDSQNVHLGIITIWSLFTEAKQSSDRTDSRGIQSLRQRHKSSYE